MRWIILFVKLSYFCGRKQRLMKRGIKLYLLTAFLLVGMSLGMSAKDFVVVIDAGHGGKDVGAVGDKAREKDVNLGVALKLGANIAKEHTDVKVVYTRDDDTFISLQERPTSPIGQKETCLFPFIRIQSTSGRSAVIPWRVRRHIRLVCIGRKRILTWRSGKIP